MKAEPSGLLLWFDPATEFLRLYSLPDSEGSQGDPVDPEGSLDREGGTCYLDMVGSVSASEAEARAVSGNRELDQLDLSDLLTNDPQGVMLNHG